jgi:hypothetical protein
MHFVGNRAIILGGGEKEIQLYYSSSFTAVSAILPIIVIFMGLLIVDRFYKGSKSFTTRYLALLGCPDFRRRIQCLSPRIPVALQSVPTLEWYNRIDPCHA